MFGEGSLKIERGANRLKTLAPFLFTLVTMGFPNISHAETPQSETIGVAESLGDVSLAQHVNGNEAIAKRAEECKVAYNAAMNLRKDTKGAKSVWLVVDTALGGSAVKDHIQLAHDGIEALKSCFKGSGEHPRIAHIINGESSDPGISLRPIDGSQLEKLLVDVNSIDAEGSRVLHRAITLNLERDDPSFKSLREMTSGAHIGDTLRNIDSVTLGYSASRATTEQHQWEFNDQLGFVTGEETAIVARGSAGVATILSPLEGGRTTVGVATELSHANGRLDASAGTYLQTSLGNGRPDLVLSTLVNPKNGNLELQSQMALRFSLANLKTTQAKN